MIKNIEAIILAAGKSTRFNTDTTKLAATICGQPMILFPTKLLQSLSIPTTVVLGYQREALKNIIETEHGNTINCVTQETQNGTGHALATTKHYWHEDNILVLNGDVPLITSSLVTQLHHQHTLNNATISFITSDKPHSTQGYGLVIKNSTSTEIIEAKDFTGNYDEHSLINAGIYLIKKEFLLDAIATLNNDNASKEFYITDLVKIAHEKQLTVITVNQPFNTIRGINTLQELSAIEQIKRSQLINHWMNQGVRFSFTDNVHLDLNVTIGQGTIIASNVHIRGNTTIGKNCTIGEFSSLDNAVLEDNVRINSHSYVSDSFIESHAQVGPFAHLRNNVAIGKNSVIGNFVEIKNSTIGMQTNAKHLTYIGDATIGSHVNIGAGTITCNYDGKNKHKTIIHNNAFIGSNNTLIAPVTIGDNAFTAAGSTITDNVPNDALAIARSHQTNKSDYAKKLKSKKTLVENEDPHPHFSFMGARVLHPNTPVDDL